MTLEELRASTRATITMKEAAEILGVDARTVSAAARAGDFPAVRCGRRVLVPRHRFLAYVDGDAERETEPAPAPIAEPDASDDLRRRLLAVLLEDDASRSGIAVLRMSGAA